MMFMMKRLFLLLVLGLVVSCMQRKVMTCAGKNESINTSVTKQEQNDKAVVEKGAEGINARGSKDGCTALHVAAGDGHTAVVEKLLEKGAEVNVPDNKGRTPLHVAASNGHTAVVEKLLEKGAEVNRLDNKGLTPRDLAASNGHTDVVALLLKKPENSPRK